MAARDQTRDRRKECGLGKGELENRRAGECEGVKNGDQHGTGVGKFK